jgi:hypothetical protein
MQTNEREKKNQRQIYIFTAKEGKNRMIKEV